MDITSIFFFGRKPPEPIKWQDVRREILITVEQERKLNARLVVPDANLDTELEVDDQVTNKKTVEIAFAESRTSVAPRCESVTAVS